MRRIVSRREKRLWIWGLVVYATILSTLFLGQPLRFLMQNQDVQAFLFLSGMILVAVIIIAHGIRTRPKRNEIAVWLGIITVYLLFFLRLGLAERSHLIEYSVLAIIIHKALFVRYRRKNQSSTSYLHALVLTFLLGLIDEALQLFIPNRMFDPLDILFNGIAITFALGANMTITWIRQKFK